MMSDRSEIEWTDATWNPTRGCTKVSPGCRECYALTFAERFRGVPGSAYERGFDPRLAPEMLEKPFTWAGPRKVFVNSMSDLFHEAFPLEYIGRVAWVMERASWHTYQVLTKRSERMRDMLSGPLRRAAGLPHVWWGVSVEDRRFGLPRVDHLRQIPARVRFLSVEPLLEDLGPVDLTGIHWVIAGGESGRRPRVLDPDWVRSIRDQCREANVPFFFKQWGGRNKKRAGRGLDGRTHDELPPVPVRPVAPIGDRRAWVEELRHARRANGEPIRIGLPPGDPPGSGVA
jgi:protein gp37